MDDDDIKVMVVCVKKHDFYKCTYAENTIKADMLQKQVSAYKPTVFSLDVPDNFTKIINSITFMPETTFVKRYSNEK